MAEKISMSHTAEPSKNELPRTSAGGKKPAKDIEANIKSPKFSPFVTFYSEKSLYDPSITSTIPISSFLSIVKLLNYDFKNYSRGALLYSPLSKNNPLAIPPNQFLYSSV
jgi:hypothetical protein